MSRRRVPKQNPTARPRIIVDEDDIRDGIRALRRKCSFIRLMHDQAGDPPLRRREPGLEGLARIIVGQQVSVASAAAIWGRLETAVQPFTAGAFLALSDDALGGCGLSRGKIRTLTAVATAITAGQLELDQLAQYSDEQVHTGLTAIHGIGPWTADVFLLFCLGRADAFAAGDLALQAAAQSAMDLGERPGAAALLELAERWRPWRGVAARLLWSYYAATKSARSGQPV